MLNTGIFLVIAIFVFTVFAAGYYQRGVEQTPTRIRSRQVDCEIRRILNKNRFQSLKRKGRIK